MCCECGEEETEPTTWEQISDFLAGLSNSLVREYYPGPKHVNWWDLQLMKFYDENKLGEMLWSNKPLSLSGIEKWIPPTGVKWELK